MDGHLPIQLINSCERSAFSGFLETLEENLGNSSGFSWCGDRILYSNLFLFFSSLFVNSGFLKDHTLAATHFTSHRNMIHCCHLPSYKGPARYDYTFSPEDLAISDGRFPFCRAISSYPFCGWDFPWNKPSNFLCIPHGFWKIQKKHIGIDDLPSYTSIDRWLSSPVGLPDPESPQIWGFLILFPKYKWP